jgi:hypothetical protein
MDASKIVASVLAFALIQCNYSEACTKPMRLADRFGCEFEYYDLGFISLSLSFVFMSVFLIFDRKYNN